MYRTEYPRPQFVRKDWINLNGTWEYETDRSDSGTDRRLFLPDAAFHEKIEVPFCRESVLSGIGDTDFCAAVWYRKTLTLPANFAGKRVFLHIGASDYRTTLWVNGKEVGSHFGGYVSFSFELTPYLSDGENTLTMRVTDDLRSKAIPRGKQSDRYGSYNCLYTRTTGIWQTVWLEAVEQSFLRRAEYLPDIDAGTLTIRAQADAAEGMTVTAAATYEGRPAGTASATVNGKEAILTLRLSELHLWEVGNGRLYDLTLTLGNDRVESYFGMRSIGCKDGILLLNHKPVFQRLVLDQGFYPDGIYTAPSDEALLGDVERSIAMGFNGARLHQKIFEERFLYHCDRLGYIVWGEAGNWGLDISAPAAWKGFVSEWLEALRRDFDHPAIIGWCPLNETQFDQDPDLVRFLADLTRACDPTRLFIEASGWRHVPGIADIIDVHDYNQNPATFAETYAPLAKGETVRVHTPAAWKSNEMGYATFVSEYGGIRWNPAEEHESHTTSWGYGNTPASREEFIARFRGLSEALLFLPGMGGLCYTQLTDVEQEQNGLYTYDRVPKFDPEEIRAILAQPAAIEK